MIKEQFYSDPQLHKNIQFITQFIDFIKATPNLIYRVSKNQITISNDDLSLSLKNVPTDPFYPYNTNWFLYFNYNKKTKNHKSIQIKTPLAETQPFSPIFNAFEYANFSSDKVAISQSNIINFLKNGTDKLITEQLSQCTFENKDYKSLVKNNQVVDLIKEKVPFNKQCIQFHFSKDYYLEVFRPSDYNNFGYASYEFRKVEADDGPLICIHTLKSGFVSLLTMQNCSFFNNLLEERNEVLEKQKKTTMNRFYFRSPITLEEPHSFISFEKTHLELEKFVQGINNLQYENELFSFFNWKEELTSNYPIEKASDIDSLALKKRLKI